MTQQKLSLTKVLLNKLRIGFTIRFKRTFAKKNKEKTHEKDNRLDTVNDKGREGS